VKIRIRSALAGAVALAVATGIVVGGGTAAYAAVTPGWEPDAGALGTISFYNAAGAPVTGGSVNDHPAAFYAVASGPGRTGDTLAQLRLATPQVGVSPALWSQDSLTGATAYPNSSAPANIRNLTVPVASGTAGDLSVADYVGEFPNNLTTSGYQNLYEFRIYTSGPGQGAGASYYRVDIQVDMAAGTWAVVYPAAATPTSTSISANPASSPQPHGTSVTLTATVSPAAAGSVHFFDGATDLGAAAYNASTGIATLTGTPVDGAHSFTAVFTSSDPAFTGSTSTALSYSITPAGSPTSTTLAASPTSPATGDASGNASVTLTSTTTPAGTAGSVHFFDGATDLGAGTYTQATGVATKTVTLTVSGSPHQITATFTPTSSTVAPSTSLVLSYTVLPSNYGTAGIPITATNTTAPYAGALALQVATGTSVTLTQVDPTTAAGHPVQATDPTGHRHAWVFTGGLSGVAVQDSRPGQTGWTLTGQASDFVGPAQVSAKNLGWNPALVAAGSDAEGAVAAGPSVDSMFKTASSNGLSTANNLAKAPAGAGLGTQNLSAGLELRIPDTSPTGTYTSTLTLTLISP
jgi:hypothetical protein